MHLPLPNPPPFAFTVSEGQVWRGYLESLSSLLRQPLASQRGMVLLEARARLADNLARLHRGGVKLPAWLTARAQRLIADLDALFHRVVHLAPPPETAPVSPSAPPPMTGTPPSRGGVTAAAQVDPEPDATISEAELDDGGPPVDIKPPRRRSYSFLHWPLPHVRVTSSFGYRRDPISGRRGFHDGIDLSAKRGAVVMAAAGGRVTFAAHRGGGGKVVVVLHAPGVKTVYAHLDQFLVVGGERVAGGQPIGLVGSTGRSTGPHLHFVVRVGGRPVNPLSVVGWPAAAIASR